MKQTTKIQDTEEAWDDGTLGTDERYAQVAPQDLQDAVIESLGMQAISIRLPKALVEQYKLIARIHKVGYQPLMRDALTRFATHEMKRLLLEVADQRDAEAEVLPDPDAHKKVA